MKLIRKLYLTTNRNSATYYTLHGTDAKVLCNSQNSSYTFTIRVISTQLTHNWHTTDTAHFSPYSTEANTRVLISSSCARFPERTTLTYCHSPLL